MNLVLPYRRIRRKVNMARYIEQTFQNQTVELDHNEYVSCKFLDCIFTYYGSAPVRLNGSRIESGNLRLLGAAANTVELLSQCRNTGLRESVKRILDPVCRDVLSAQPE